MMKQVMIRAWEIAREAVKKFGGKVKEFFQQSLIIAWKEAKGVVEMVELKGSEKQIAWAEDIRSMITKVYDITIELHNKFGESYFCGINYREDIENLYNKISSTEEAKTLINAYSSLKNYMVKNFETDVKLADNERDAEKCYAHALSMLKMINR